MIPDVLYEQLANQLGKIIKDGSNREKTAAARVLVAMHESNQKEQPRHVEHEHTHTLVRTTAENIEQRRSELLAELGG